MQLDVNAVSGFCFALASLLASNMGKAVGASTSSIFTTAFLMCLAFVMPSPEVPVEYPVAIIIETCQQCFLQYAISLLLCGVMINLTYGLKMSKDRHHLIGKAMDELGKLGEPPATTV